MEYQLQLKPFVGKDGFKYKTVTLTDMALHTASKQYTSSPGKKLSEIIDSDKPGRIYFPLQKPDNSEIGTPILDAIGKDPEFIRFVQEQEKIGYKILIHIPRSVPLIIGKDTKEFIHSKNGKRILRKLARNEDSSKM